jgi:hypothetical protein
MIQSLRSLHITYHGRAQRCQNTCLESILHLSTTDTSGFEYLSCTLTVSSPAIISSYERLRDRSFTVNIAAISCKTYLGYQDQLDSTKCFEGLCRHDIVQSKPQLCECSCIVDKYIWRNSTTTDTMAAMRCYDDSGSSVQCCISAEPLRYIFENRKRPCEIVFEVHGGVHRLYHRCDKNIRCGLR